MLAVRGATAAPARSKHAYVRKLIDGFVASIEAQLARLDSRPPALLDATDTPVLPAPAALNQSGRVAFSVENGRDHHASYKIQFYGRYAQRTGDT